MKLFLQHALIALTVCALTTAAAFAGGKDKVKKGSVTFASDVMVNGTLVKAGNYEVRFDEKTGELAIVKDGKVKAKTTAHLEQRGDKARDTTLRTITKGDLVELTGVTFGGSNQNIVVGASGGAVTGS